MDKIRPRPTIGGSRSKTVSVAGMVVLPNDLIHADRHSAVVIPLNVARKIPEAANLLAKRERFGIEDLRQAFSPADDIH